MFIKSPQMALVLMSACVTSWSACACSPPRPVDESGFQRAAVTALPVNARGVMFYRETGLPRAEEFSVTSPDDKRPLKLRIRSFKAYAWVRVEPVGGFLAGAHYQFRYLPAHSVWTNPDQVSVAIDHHLISTSGTYAIALAPRLVQRVAVLPTAAGSCVEPRATVAQEFDYTVPASVEPYKHALQFMLLQLAVPPFDRRPPPIILTDWPQRPQLHDLDAPDRPVHRAVIAACGNRWRRVRMRVALSFPEVDRRVYHTAAVQFDIGRELVGECGELEALLQTIAGRAPEQAMRQLCGLYLGGPTRAAGEYDLPSRDLGSWEFALSFFFGMSPSCDLVRLSQLWSTGRFASDPLTLNKLGAALKTGLERTSPALKAQTLHALAYLIGNLPAVRRREMAHHLLLPLLPQLIELLGGTDVDRPDELMRLIASAGALSPDLHARVEKMAAGHNAAAQRARALLAKPAAF